MPAGTSLKFGWLLILAGVAPRAHMLVSTDWLSRHLKDPNLVVLHVARQESAYEAGHIAGARYLDFQELVTTRDGIPNELPPAAELQRVFERLGVGDRARVVLYGDILAASRAYFTLDYLGCGARAALLDGGLEKWRAEGRPLSTQTPQGTPGRLKVRARPEVVASRQAVEQPAPGVVLLDARPAADYAAGHIPGAVNVYWLQDLVSKDNPVLRPVSELRRLYQAAGLKPGGKVITYCNSGVQATQSYFTLEYLGYDVALYDGSLTEWTRAPGAPLVKGPLPK